MPEVIQDIGEKPLILYSDARQPLSKMSFMRRALALGELAMIAYNDEDEARRAGEAIGFPEVELFDRDGSQAYLFRNAHDCVIACRGTEVNDWNDIEADAKATLAVVGALGKVHTGFNQEVDDVWPLLLPVLERNRQNLYFCGHSLGGGMATIAAYRCKKSAMKSRPKELHTFGSPRVGNRRYVRHTRLKHYRWVHNNDIVTRLPPTWMGYWHCGREIYLDRHGRIRRLTGVLRRRDRWKGFLAGLGRGQLDMLSDHPVHLYVEHIRRAVEKERRSGKRLTASELVVDKPRDAPSFANGPQR